MIPDYTYFEAFCLRRAQAAINKRQFGRARWWLNRIRHLDKAQMWLKKISHYA